MKNKKARVIAFYLPQYHPTKENDLWWGKGFTEWTNVGKAKPLFKNHYQPRVPADLGYYDLRLSQIREAQAHLAKAAGIEGFCYYHYWFGNGKQQLEMPFNEVVKTGNPVFPFCLCWANESWNSKFWNIDGTIEKKLLIEQKYLGENDDEAHFYSLLDAFKDERYIKVDGKLLFMIYRPLEFVNVESFISKWQQLAKINNLNGFYFIGQSTNFNDYKTIKGLGFDAINILRLHDCIWKMNKFHHTLIMIKRKIFHLPFIYSYKKAIKHFIGEEEEFEECFPSIIPNWDHTPRSGKGGYLLHGATPELFEYHCDLIFEKIKNKSDEKKIVFLKSWNEWGEGNYMEPDVKYGMGFINALSNAIKRYE